MKKNDSAAARVVQTAAPRCDTTASFALTRFTVHQPKRLSKRFCLAGDELLKETGGNLVDGEAERVEIPGLGEFAELLTGLTPDQALAYGVNGHDHARVVTGATLEAAAGGALPVIARDQRHFSWPKGGGIFLGDYDPQDGETPLTREQLLERLYRVWPELRTAPHLGRPSASSCIHNTETGEELRGISGQHIYIMVKDAGDLPRAGQALNDRLWLDGQGRVKISKSGALLTRSPIDTIFQPERLDFAGGADCEPPLVQRLPDPVLYNANAPPLDTRTLLDLTEAEKVKVAELQATAKAARAAEAAGVRAAWQAARVEELARRHPNVSKSRLRKVVKQAVQGGVLGPEFVLYDASMRPVTVAELLADPECWHGKYIRDPLEPEYGSSTAWVCLKGKGAPFLHSHAHGLGVRYELSLARGEIHLKSGDLSKVVASAIEAMRDDGLLFEHGGELARLVSEGVEPASADWLRTYLSRLIRFIKFDGRRKAEVVVDCPQELPRLVLAQRGAWGLPVLRGVISAPLVRLDGSVLEERGYDATTGLYLDRQPESPIKLHPSRAEAEDALRRLWLPFTDFPFVTKADRGVMLAALLTACVRPVLPTAPGFGFDAPASGSGKTLLVKCLALLAGVGDPAMMPPVVQEDELRKRLLAALRQGKRVMVLDNQVGKLNSASLCAFLTSPAYGDRVLGQSQVMQFQNTSLFMVTGNNFQPVGDLTRRILVCRIDPQMERPDKRGFALDPEAYVAQHRQVLVRDALAVLLGHRRLDLVGGRRGRGRMASFELWDDVVRQAVLWAGGLGVLELGDPMDSIDTACAQDPERAKLAAMLVSWYALFGGKPTKVGKAIEEVGGLRDPLVHGALDGCEGANSRLRGAMLEIAGEGRVINSRRLGRWIEARADRIVEGLRFERGPNHGGVATWKVRQV